MKSLDEVLKELNEAEKEFKEKCDKYGIEETKKRKPKESGVTNSDSLQEASNNEKNEEISQNNG